MNENPENQPLDFTIDLSQVKTDGPHCPKCESYHWEDDGISPCSVHPFGFQWRTCLDCGEVFDF